MKEISSITFGIVGLLVALIGFFRFDNPGQESHFIYTLLIGFAIAGFPWIKSINIKGLFEMKKVIDTVKEETQNIREETNKNIHNTADKIDHNFRELRTYVNAIQTQISSQKVDTNVAVNVNERQHTKEELKQIQGEKKEFEKQAKAYIETKDNKTAGWLKNIFSTIGSFNELPRSKLTGYHKRSLTKAAIVAVVKLYNFCLRSVFLHNS